MKKIFLFTLLVFGFANCMAMGNSAENATAPASCEELNASADAIGNVELMLVINGGVILDGQTITIPSGYYVINVMFTMDGGASWHNVHDCMYNTDGGANIVDLYPPTISLSSDGSLTAASTGANATFHFDVF